MSYVISRKTKAGIVYFQGFENALPRWVKDTESANVWDNKLHAEAQAQLLRSDPDGLGRILAEALSA